MQTQRAIRPLRTEPVDLAPVYELLVDADDAPTYEVVSV
jgi:hypothetical protein